MLNREILNAYNKKRRPTRVCDVRVDRGKAFLVYKRNGKLEIIPWEEVVRQVNRTIEEEYSQELS